MMQIKMTEATEHSILTTTPEGVTSAHDVDDYKGIGPELWVPYLVLTIVLSAMAVGSFIHYHINNKSRYVEKSKPVSEPTSRKTSNKYRVTLGRNAFNQKAALKATTQLQVRTAGDTSTSSSEKTSSAGQTTKHGDTNKNKQSTGHGEHTSKRDRRDEEKNQRNKSTEGGRPAGYVNDAYESPNCDSDKSLISSSSCDPQLRTQESVVSDVTIGKMESVQRKMSKDSLSKSDRHTGKLKRKDTPLYLPDNSNISKQVFFTGDILGEAQKAQAGEIGRPYVIRSNRVFLVKRIPFQ